MNGKKVLRRTLICIASLLVSLAALEAILRLVLGLGNPVMVVYDPACGYTLKPDQNVYRFFAHTRTNRYGMRSQEVPAKLDPGRLRILFVGDSLTYGTSRVDQDEIFTEILHRKLPILLHKPVDVLNASAGAWAPDNEVSYIRSRGIFQSDYVVFVLNDGDLTQPRSSLSDVGDGLEITRGTTALEELWARYLKPRLFRAVVKPDAGIAIDTGAQRVVETNLRDLDAAAGEIAGAGAQMAIVFLPFRRDVPFNSARAESTLSAWCAKHRVPFLDLTQAELPYSADYLDLDAGYHFNSRGNAVVAQGILDLWPRLMPARSQSAREGESHR